MILHKFSICFFIFIFFGQFFLGIKLRKLSHQENYFNGVRFKSVKCQSDNITVVIKYCYLKAVSRKIVTLNFGIKLLVPYTKPYYIHSVFFYRYGTIFREIIDTKKLEICGILDGLDTNPLVKLVVDMMKSRMPENILHKCPYKDDWGFNNFTLNTDIADGTFLKESTAVIFHCTSIMSQP